MSRRARRPGRCRRSVRGASASRCQRAARRGNDPLAGLGRAQAGGERRGADHRGVVAGEPVVRPLAPRSRHVLTGRWPFADDLVRTSVAASRPLRHRGSSYASGKKRFSYGTSTALQVLHSRYRSLPACYPVAGCSPGVAVHAASVTASGAGVAVAGDAVISITLVGYGQRRHDPHDKPPPQRAAAGRRPQRSFGDRPNSGSPGGCAHPRRRTNLVG
jgi:hypothetical protein